MDELPQFNTSIIIYSPYGFILVEYTCGKP